MGYVCIQIWKLRRFICSFPPCPVYRSKRIEYSNHSVIAHPHPVFNSCSRIVSACPCMRACVHVYAAQLKAIFEGLRVCACMCKCVCVFFFFSVQIRAHTCMFAIRLRNYRTHTHIYKHKTFRVIRTLVCMFVCSSRNFQFP